MKKLNFKKFLIPFFFIVLFIFLRIYLFQTSTFLYGDSLSQILVVESFYENGEIPLSFPFIKGHFGFPRFGSFPVTYPPGYYILAYIFYPIFGEKVLIFMGFIASFLLSFAVFYFLDKKFSKISVFFSVLLTLITSYAVFTDWDQDFVVATLSIISILFYLLFLENKKTKNFTLSLIVGGISLGIKQTSIFPLIAVIFHFFIFILCPMIKKKDRKVKKLLLPCAVLVILACFNFGYLIFTTGTISSPTIRGNFLDRNIFSPKFLEISDFNKEIDEKIELVSIANQGATYYRSKYDVFGKGVPHLQSIFSEYFNLIPEIKYPVGNLNNNYFSLIYSLLTVFGIISFFVHENSEKKTFFLFLFIFSLVPLYMFKKINYVLYFPVISVVFFARGMDLTLKNIRMKKTISVIYIIFMILTVFISYNNYKKVDKYLVEKYEEYKIVSNVLNNLLPESKTIMVNETNIWPFFLKRDVFWDYRLFFLQKNDLIYYLDNGYKPSAIIIDKTSIVEEWKNWVQIPQRSAFLEVVNNEDFFIKIYEDSRWIIYSSNTLY